jgi:hypothetical protein
MHVNEDRAFVFADSQIAALVPASWGGESDTWKLFSEV